MITQISKFNSRPLSINLVDKSFCLLTPTTRAILIKYLFHDITLNFYQQNYQFGLKMV